MRSCDDSGFVSMSETSMSESSCSRICGRNRYVSRVNHESRPGKRQRWPVSSNSSKRCKTQSRPSSHSRASSPNHRARACDRRSPDPELHTNDSTSRRGRSKATSRMHSDSTSRRSKCSGRSSSGSISSTYSSNSSSNCSSSSHSTRGSSSSSNSSTSSSCSSCSSNSTDSSSSSTTSSSSSSSSSSTDSSSSSSSSTDSSSSSSSSTDSCSSSSTDSSSSSSSSSTDSSSSSSSSSTDSSGSSTTCMSNASISNLQKRTLSQAVFRPRSRDSSVSKIYSVSDSKLSICDSLNNPNKFETSTTTSTSIPQQRKDSTFRIFSWLDSSLPMAEQRNTSTQSITTCVPRIISDSSATTTLKSESRNKMRISDSKKRSKHSSEWSTTSESTCRNNDSPSSFVSAKKCDTSNKGHTDSIQQCIELAATHKSAFTVPASECCQPSPPAFTANRRVYFVPDNPELPASTKNTAKDSLHPTTLTHSYSNRDTVALTETLAGVQIKRARCTRTDSDECVDNMHRYPICTDKQKTSDAKMSVQSVEVRRFEQAFLFNSNRVNKEVVMSNSECSFQQILSHKHYDAKKHVSQSIKEQASSLSTTAMSQSSHSNTNHLDNHAMIASDRDCIKLSICDDSNTNRLTSECYVTQPKTTPVKNRDTTNTTMSKIVHSKSLLDDGKKKKHSICDESQSEISSTAGCGIDKTDAGKYAHNHYLEASSASDDISKEVLTKPSPGKHLTEPKDHSCSANKRLICDDHKVIKSERLSPVKYSQKHDKEYVFASCAPNDATSDHSSLTGTGNQVCQSVRCATDEPVIIPGLDIIYPASTSELHKKDVIVPSDLTDHIYDPAKLVKIAIKREEMNQTFQQDCETLSAVVKMLISKDPIMRNRLQVNLFANLSDIAEGFLSELQDYIQQVYRE